MAKQVLCPVCGTVAEVRRQKNGQRLRFMNCKHGHGGLHTRKDAAKWEAEEQNYIGVYGELPPGQSEPDAQTSTEEEPRTLPEAANDSDDWIPEPEESPADTDALSDDLPRVETMAVDDDREAVNDSALPKAAKVGIVVVLTLLGIGGGIHYRNKNKKVA